MRRIISIIFITQFICLVGDSFAQKADDQKTYAIAEENVAIVGNQTVSVAELFQTTQQLITYRKEYGVGSKLKPEEEAFEMLLRQKLLTVCAKLDSMDKKMNSIDGDIQNRIEEMINEAGSIGNLERNMGKAISQIREDFKEMIIDSRLASMMEQTVVGKVTITHSEVLDFVKNFDIDSLPPQPKQLSYAQIIKMPPSTEERKYEVRQRLLEYRDRILRGDKFDMLARLYSQDEGTRRNGGEMAGNIAELVTPFAEAIKQLKPGQISEIVETEFGYHIIELISRNGNAFRSRHILMKPQFTADEEQKAYADLDSIANVIREGKITFAEAAQRYSDDPKTRANGGLMLNMYGYFTSGGDVEMTSTIFQIDKMDPQDGNFLDKMKAGDVSVPFQNMDEKGNIIYKIVTLISYTPVHKININDDYEFFYQKALEDKKNKVVNEWLDKQIGNIYVRISPDYLSYNLTNEAWKRQSEKYANK